MKVAVAYYYFVYRCIFALYVSGRMLLFFFFLDIFQCSEYNSSFVFSAEHMVAR